MKSVITISASLAISLMLCCTAQANDHKILGVIAMPIRTSVAESTMMMKLIYQYEIERFL
ncbi:hypothetical protein HmCmsJML101_01325 [Escherichia coli]|uniref:DUF2541 family protein n=1 Tax=Escherichia coli TaxID=562 RepID=UPI0010CF0683|nr:hypothetical protein HmCmsJML101_01325 [Escherichia coli]